MLHGLKAQAEIRSTMKQIPYDPVMLLSYLNTQLRDNYPSLKELCDSLDLDEADLEKRLAAIDYRYNAERNQFV